MFPANAIGIASAAAAGAYGGSKVGCNGTFGALSAADLAIIGLLVFLAIYFGLILS